MEMYPKGDLIFLKPIIFDNEIPMAHETSHKAAERLDMFFPRKINRCATRIPRVASFPIEVIVGHGPVGHILLEWLGVNLDGRR